MTAQHATRQGKLVAQNVAASLGKGTASPYKHHDLGFLVDVGGLAAAANPLHIPLSGRPPASSPAATTCTPCPATGRGCWPTGP
jgi:NADH dehydrogenase FAD-containing subunit